MIPSSSAVDSTGRTSVKPWRAQALGVLRLAEHRDVLRQQLRCRVVEVVEVHVRDEHGVDARDDDLGRLGQLHERVAAVVLGVLDRGAGARRVEHRVDEQLPAGELEPQRRVADQAQVHRLARYLHGPRPSRTGPRRALTLLLVAWRP